MDDCTGINLSVKPGKYRRMTKKNKIKWHKCYMKSLTRHKTHTKRSTKKKGLQMIIRDQEAQLKALEKK